MKILCVSGYSAWEKVSKHEMPSHHLYGIHELVDHYELLGESVRGILKNEILDGGYVDFYLWKGGKYNILRQTRELVKLSKQYDLVYDIINRCSFFLGITKRFRLFQSKLITVMHHPPYKTQLKLSMSDAYVFFNEDYRKIAIDSDMKKKNKFFVNEWKPDRKWYQTEVGNTKDNKEKECFYIDNGKSRRDREVLLSAAEQANIRVDYAGDKNESSGWARAYMVNLKDDLAQLRKLKNYKAIIIPIKAEEKEKIGPLGITSFLDAMALGIPVIASDNVCFANEVIEKKLGLIYKTGESESLKNQIQALYKDKELYSNIVNSIKRNYVESINDYAKKLSEIILLTMDR